MDAAQPPIPIGSSGRLEALPLTNAAGNHAILVRQADAPRALVAGEAGDGDRDRVVVVPLDSDVQLHVDGDALAIWLAEGSVAVPRGPAPPAAGSRRSPGWWRGWDGGRRRSRADSAADLRPDRHAHRAGVRAARRLRALDGARSGAWRQARGDDRCRARSGRPGDPHPPRGWTVVELRPAHPPASRREPDGRGVGHGQRHRRAPRALSMTDEQRGALRAMMGRFGTGVTVVAARQGPLLAGMTANAIASISIDPPLLMASINRSSETHAALVGSHSFAA